MNQIKNLSREERETILKSIEDRSIELRNANQDGSLSDIGILNLTCFLGERVKFLLDEIERTKKDAFVCDLCGGVSFDEEQRVYSYKACAECAKEQAGKG